MTYKLKEISPEQAARWLKDDDVIIHSYHYLQMKEFGDWWWMTEGGVDYAFEMEEGEFNVRHLSIGLFNADDQTWTDMDDTPDKMHLLSQVLADPVEHSVAVETIWSYDKETDVFHMKLNTSCHFSGCYKHKELPQSWSYYIY